MTKLFVKSVRSYSPDVDVEFDLSSKVNLIYGLNGSGKSTISGYFFNPSNPEYANCRLTPDEDVQFLVFNQDYIDETFHNSQTQPGVFTLNNENAEITKIIDDNNREITSNIRKIDIKNNNAREKRELKESVCSKIIDEIWNRTASIRKSEVSNLVNWMSRKQRLFEAINGHDNIKENEFSELEERYKYLNKFKEVKYSIIPKLILPVLSGEDSNILSTPLLSTSNSQLSKSIEKLSNSDWVRSGVKFLVDDQCPFCQQKINSNDFKKELNNIFDETYKEGLLEVDAVKKRYATWRDSLDSYLLNFNDLGELIDNNLLSKNISDIKHHYDSNEKLIQRKISSPSESIFLNIDQEILNGFIKQVNDLNQKIEYHNKKIDNYDDECEMLRKDLLSHLRLMNESSINRYHEQSNELDELIEKLDKEVESINNKNKQLQSENRLKSSEVVNIEETISHINDSLISLGIMGFTLIKHQDESETYRLHREGQSNTKSVFKSLSEGEKTIISFLYFLEQCKGLKNKDDIIKDKFIVIDDPISSLSHNYIYEISAMIFNDLILKDVAKKFIILTHSLFFFQELVIIANSEKNVIKNWSFNRIVKGNYSQCYKLKKDDILNEYQSLWQVLKDAKNGIVNSIILPNLMRNILEYYFSFSCKKDKLKEVLKSLADSHAEPRYNSFYRFINRHSHSDGKNIQSIGHIEVSVYLEMFERIFTDTGDQEHFIAMMGTKDIA
ncbi:AAA family ATPase [Erwinia sp. E602]|uniref:AAA family ATPase n=1 Tax=Erwinia sp. E602 TaxID=2675378 RepID=UPI001BA88C9A|nr:AAA family ATPase [Erwinia sp. E602]QUG77298.1 AAA family ATPase [Erwinia sp. E602]